MVRPAWNNPGERGHARRGPRRERPATVNDGKKPVPSAPAEVVLSHFRSARNGASTRLSMTTTKGPDGKPRRRLRIEVNPTGHLTRFLELPAHVLPDVIAAAEQVLETWRRDEVRR